MKYFYNQNSRFLSYFVKKKTKKKQGRQISVAGSGGLQCNSGLLLFKTKTRHIVCVVSSSTQISEGTCRTQQRH